jgi:acyl-CoA hydrolase
MYVHHTHDMHVFACWMMDGCMDVAIRVHGGMYLSVMDVVIWVHAGMYLGDRCMLCVYECICMYGIHMTCMCLHVG